MADSSIKRLWLIVKNYISLNLENIKLTAAEKVTVLLTAAVISLVALLLSVVVLFFLSLALASVLESVMAPYWAYLILSGVYVLLFAALYLLRKPLIMNPVSRFITHLFLS